MEMEPPPRVGMGFLPKVAYIARLSALKGMGLKGPLISDRPNVIPTRILIWNWKVWAEGLTVEFPCTDKS